MENENTKNENPMENERRKPKMNIYRYEFL